MAWNCDIPDCDRKRHSPKWCKTSVCSIPDCESPTTARGWCNRHYLRWKAHGDVLVDIAERTPNIGTCAVDGCEEPMRKRTWCSSHYSAWQKSGLEPQPSTYKWNDRTPCLMCGSDDFSIRSRQFCSNSCKARFYWHDGKLSTIATCNRCHSEFNLNEIGPGKEKRKRADSLTCNDCRRGRLAKFVAQIKSRDGENCNICDQAIDFSLAYPNPLSKSVDHIIPWAKGGTDDLGNLALAHLQCNVRRRATELNTWKEVMTYRS